MITTFDIIIDFGTEDQLAEPKALAQRQLSIEASRINDCVLIKRSLDARKKQIKVNLKYQVYLDEDDYNKSDYLKFSTGITNSDKTVHIIGTGPAGLFAALACLENGLKPILFERGKDVRSRRRDLAQLNKEQIVNPESNYCFGEGGAGTYSDGKLYTRSKKRGDVNKVLELLIHFGADPNISIEAHPHIGTNKLPKIITTIRDYIIAQGGEVHFESKLTGLNVHHNRISHIEVNQKEILKVEHLILATGHSARDVFILLKKENILIEAKPFALGVRVEHPQELINTLQYHSENHHPDLPPAAYQLVHQVDNKGVYSFCMCPGGIIAPCATTPGEIVTNGWSPSKRNNPFANSGIVVSVEENNWAKYKAHGPLAALHFQAEVEQRMFDSVNSKKDGQLAPAQRLKDFVEGKASKDLPPCSYYPGIVPARLDLLLDDFISDRLRKAFVAFGKKMKGYLTNDAVVVGVESRTSSPVRIPRDKENLQHLEIENLYPCGEGAGYAGGIVSAAIDGMKVAEAIHKTVD